MFDVDRWVRFEAEVECALPAFDDDVV